MARQLVRSLGRITIADRCSSVAELELLNAVRTPDVRSHGLDRQ